MKRILSALVIALTLWCPMLANNGDDGPVKIIVTETVPSTGEKGNHAPVRKVIECDYYPIINTIELTFIANLGKVSVILDNQKTGELQNYLGDSSFGKMIFPVMPDSYYIMDISTESGRSFKAIFHTTASDIN